MAFKIENGFLTEYIPEENEKVITIPEGVTDFKWNVFENCNHLEKIILPKSIQKIHKYDLANSKMKEIVLPEGLTEIEEAAFRYCTNLKKIRFPETVRDIGCYTFMGCENLKEIILPEQLKNIGIETFSGCKSLVSVKFPAGIRSVCQGAFYGCKKLNKIEFDTSGERISLHDECFQNCALKEVHLHMQKEIWWSMGNAFDPDVLVHIHLPNQVFTIPFGIWKSPADRERTLFFLGYFTESDADFDEELKKKGRYSYFQQIKGGECKILLADFMIRNYPEEEVYQNYIKRNIKKAIKLLTDLQDIPGIENLLKTGYVTKKNIDEFIRYAIDSKKTEIQVILMNWKNENIPAESIEK